MEKRNKSILQINMNVCYMCGRPKECIHEVFFGSANRKKSIEWGCYVALCNEHHNMSNRSVHMNRELDLALKEDMQERFELIYSHEKFMEIFHKSYL